MYLKNGKYYFSGQVPATQIAERYGTPVYVYEADLIERQYRRLQDAFSIPNARIYYACKANTNLQILKLLRSWGAGLDCVSIQEVQLGILAGFQPSDILFTPNCVSLAEYEMAHEIGTLINIDNISILEQFSQRFPGDKVCIRINPHIMAGGNSKISTGHIDSKFGISIHQMPLVHRVIEATGLKVEGVHMHTGSDILDPDVFLFGAEIMLKIAKEFPGLEYLDFGSGFKVPYKEGDIETNIEELGEMISERFNEFCKEYGRDLCLMFEPGKFLVSDSGSFLVQVNVVKQTTSTVFAGIDSGLNHLIRPMFYNSFHRITNVSKPGGRARFYTVVGYICETDTFGINRRIAEINEGDILCIHNAGAYCFSMASNYNSRFRPAEVLIYKGQPYLIRQRETMEDLLRNQVETSIFEKEVVE